MKKNILAIIIITLLLLMLLDNYSFAEGGDKDSSNIASETRTLEDGTYIIKSAINNNYVLDISGASKSNGGNIQIWTNSSVSQQRFVIKYLNNGYYSITSSNSGKVLDVTSAGKSSGTNVQQWGYNATDAQQWMIKDESDGYYNVISKCNNLYLDVSSGIAKNGTNIQVYAGNDTNAQKFKFEKYEEGKITGKKTIEDGTYIIKSAINNNYVLDISGASKSDGGNIQIWTNSSVSQQRFVIKYLNNGYYSITSSNSGKVLDVTSAGKSSGTNVQQWGYNATDAQQWMIKDESDGYYNVISKCNNLYLDVSSGIAKNGTNIQVYAGNDTNAQKFKFEKYEEGKITGKKTIEDGTYIIKSAINNNYVLDISAGSKQNGGNLQIWTNSNVAQQRFGVQYLNNGYYTITSINSDKVLEVVDGSKQPATNVQQYTSNGTDAQKWVIKETGDGYYYIISKCNGLYLDVNNADAKNGTNIQVYTGNNSKAQKFIFEEVKTTINIDTTKYPGYKEKIEALIEAHPNWNFELLYTGLSLDEVVSGEAKVHSRNLVPSDKSGEWICSVCGTKPYDSGWYCASEKATAYYMDPRNFLDEVNIFQFQDVNEYISGVFTLEGIQNQINNTYLQNYANDIDTACRNKNVNPYYIISRLIQEQGRNGTTIGKGMDGGDGKTYYNPFNIGASGNGWNEIYANALARAKKEGWDTMEKAIEGGITFCKANWLENYQNTLYQNKFDIDTRNGTSLYTHQYMQNLMGAYSEAQLLQGMYANTGKINSYFTFIIPVYENMSSTVSQLPSNSSEIYPMDVETTGTNINVRKEANTNSAVIRTISEKGTKLLSIERGINTNWQKVIFTDGTIGYVSGTYLKQIDDQVNCNIRAKVKTNDGYGCNTRLGPSTSIQKGPYLDEATEVTIINKGTYNNIDGYNWYRIRLSDGRQAFIPGKYLKTL